MTGAVATFDVCFHGFLAWAAYLAARATARGFPRFATQMGWAALATFLATCSWGYAELQPDAPFTMLGVVTVSFICGCFAALATAAVLPPLAALRDGWKQMKARASVEERQKRDDELRAEEAAH